tara:strand:- start:77 stop:316 length:240 start_codon:yes stop_codon:yes gene_type:complete
MNFLKELSDQFKRGLKHELLDTAGRKHKEAKAKKKTYRQVSSAGKAAREKLGKNPKGIRALHQGKWGYVKNNKFKPDKN